MNILVALSELLRQYVPRNTKNLMLVFCIKHNHTWRSLAIFFISRVKGDYIQAILRWGKFSAGIQKLFDIK